MQSGANLYITYQFLSRMYHQVIIMMPEWLNKERIDIIKSFGAAIHLVIKAEGGFSGSIALAEKIKKMAMAISYPVSSKTNIMLKRTN
jgi:cysteine synthase A